MKILKHGKNFICTPENADDKYVLTSLALQSKRNTNGTYTVPDLLVNRVALQIEAVLPQPPRRIEEVLPEGQQLRDYQIRDHEKLIQLRAPLNANRPGYGKTIEALLYAKAIDAQRILVLCPKIAKLQWATLAPIWGPQLDVYIAPRKPQYEMPRIVIDNHEQLYKDAVFQLYKGTHWDLLIIDEVHRIRTGGRKSSIRTARIKSLPGVCRTGLTGSPIFNRPSDLWSICDFLNPWYFGSSFRAFQSRFCEAEETFFGTEYKGLHPEPRVQQLLRDTLDCFMVRNPAGLVGCGMLEQDVLLEMSPKQRKLYRSVTDLVYAELDKVGITVANGMTQAIRLQQVTTNPEKFELDCNPKFDWIEDFLEDTDLKLLVFSAYREPIVALNGRLGDQVTTIHGKIKTAQREQAKQRFITDPNCRVLTGTIGSMSEALDGLQNVCHDVVFLNKSWMPEANEQAIDRVLRFGQESFVNVYNLMMNRSIDQKVGRIVLKKAEDIRKVFDCDE